MRLDLLAKWDDLIRGITKNNRIAILHDADPDGVCSAIIMATLITRLRHKKPDIVLYRTRNDHLLGQKVLQTLQRKRITHLFTCDLAIDDDIQGVPIAAKGRHLVIIDHHVIHKNINSNNILLLKPQLIWDEPKPSRYPTAKLAYDLAMRLTNVRDLDWIAAAGLIADSAAPRWESFLRTVCKRYNIKPKKEWFDSELGKVARMVSTAQAFNPKTTPACYKTLLRAKRPQDLTKTRIATYQTIVEKEIHSLVHAIKKEGEWIKDLVWYEIAPKYKIKGMLSTILAKKYPHTTIIIAEKVGNEMQLSLRRNDFARPMHLAVEKAVIDIKGATGGGHIPAAGAGVPLSKYLVFKEHLLRTLTTPISNSTK